MKIDIEALSKLYREDPEKFELERERLIDIAISEAPKKHRARLKGIQFKVNATRKLAANPYDSCIKISTMMMDNLQNLKSCLVDFLHNNQQKPKTQAKVLEFKIKDIEPN